MDSNHDTTHVDGVCEDAWRMVVAVGDFTGVRGRSRVG